MALEVIGAGLGRTGTLSLKRALEQLGYAPCYHMEEVIADPAKIDGWMRAGQGLPVDWDDLFDGYRATVDWPAATFWRELAGAYPDAKVILSVRDPEAWFASTQKTIFNRERLRGMSDAFMAMADRVVYAMFDMKITDRAHCLEVYQRHNRAVIDTLPADRLLVFEANQGWEPLCAFLGCQVPQTAYPHVNKSENFEVVPD